LSLIDRIKEILLQLVEKFRNNTKMRKYSLIISIILLFLSLILLFYFKYFQQGYQNLKEFSAILAVSTIISLFVIILSYTEIEVDNMKTTKLDLQNLREEREKLENDLKTEESEQKDIFNIIRLNLNQITEYYTISKNQAKKSYNLSILAIILGLFTIIFGIWIFYFDINSNLSISILTSVAGIILEFIGGAYFYMYKENKKQLNYFYSELVDMQDIMLSIKLCNSLKEEKRNNAKEKIIDSLIKISSRENNNRFSALEN
jgi:hypothetical protein